MRWSQQPPPLQLRPTHDNLIVIVPSVSQAPVAVAQLESLGASARLL